MKKFSITFILILSVLSLIAQPPMAFKYQAVARDVNGDPISNQSVAFRIGILQGSPAGPTVYSERHVLNTNDFGLANLNIGDGIPLSGNFPSVNWSSGAHFLKVELDPAGGTIYQLMGISELLSVPYSLYSGNGVGAGTYGQTLWHNGSGWVVNDQLFRDGGNMGIGIPGPTEKLQVGGVVHSTLDGFMFPDGSLQNTAAESFSLPYEGASDFSPSFSITNPSGSIAIRGLATDPGSGISYGGYFESYRTQGRGVTGAVNGENAYGVYGYANGLNAIGVRGEAAGTNGIGIYGVGASKAGYFDGDVFTNGNIGIGVWSPAEKLSVLENFTSTNNVEDVVSLSRGSTGTVAIGEGVGLAFRNESSNGGYALAGRIASIMESVTVPNTSAGMLFQTRSAGGSMTDAIYIDPNGNVGIGNTNPTSSLDIDGDLRVDYPANGNGVKAIGNTPFALAYIQNDYEGDSWGLSAGMNSSSAGSDSYGLYGWNYGAGYGVYGKNSNNGIGTYGINSTTNNFGYLGSSNYGVYGENNNGNYAYMAGYYAVYGLHYDGNYGYIGGSQYGMFAELATTDPGDYAIYGDGTDSPGEDGTGYGYTSTLGGVKGYNYYGNPYTFGVAGYSYLDYDRSGGAFGGRYNGSAWGSMGYQRVGGTEYGGYFTSYTTGTGKDGQASVNCGIGAWGDLFGADIHGKVYGAFIEGDNYATYSSGPVFKNNLDVHLQQNGQSENAVLYTSVSTDVTVQTSGYATLTNGKASITFDKRFRDVVSESEPVIVTVTPMGKSGSVYLSAVSATGFSVEENGEGKSNVTVSYIAIGKRKGYENPLLPKEVIAADYISKLESGLHNDNDIETNSAGLYYENGQLIVGKHPSTFPDLNKQPEEVPAPAKPESLLHPDHTQNGKAPEMTDR